jgi:thiol-disulfide isomerase/thioredoxin
VLLVLTGSLTACSDVDGTDGLEYVGGEFSAVEYPAADRGAPVESTGTTVDGDPIDLASYRGRVVVLNVWWSGCGPCIKELPLLVDAAGTLGSDVALVGLNIRDNSAADAAAFERNLGVDFPSFYSPGGENLLDFQGKVSPRIVPSTLVLDRQGRVAALLSGAIPTQQTLESVVQTVIDEDPQGSTGSSGGSADG